jgi:hypothetical protein
MVMVPKGMNSAELQVLMEKLIAAEAEARGWREAVSYVNRHLRVTCSQCGSGPFAPEVLSMLYLSGSLGSTTVVFTGPSVAAAGSGRCPHCQRSSQFTVAFNG